ncbi:MAG: hypothetical protein GF355_03515 [Candidatus Eisenbacteria bacterium]|nr:hypothetical protein [Candidatus Eisenbacteria bacterium]
MDTQILTTLSLALAAGVVAGVIAHHMRIPGIVAFLAAGVVLGPDVLNWVQPHRVGHAIHHMVAFAVAIILFEGGLNLDLRRLRREGRAIRRLISAGALVTAVGGALAAHFLLQWPWRTAVLFGTLVIVTGPTVVTPLLRRLRVESKLATVLEAEGVLIDPVGAIVAVVTLQIVETTSASTAAWSAGTLVLRLGAGTAAGAMTGWILAWILQRRRLIPEGHGNIFVLGSVVCLYALSDLVITDSGILAVTVAGVVVGNRKTPLSRDLREFKEQLTVLLIGFLFVLLAAQVRLADVQRLGWPGLLVVAALMVVVRPLNILAGTAGLPFTWRQRAFMSWIAPRGIVAAAVASLFAERLAESGIAGAMELQSLVFLTIAVTVTAQGLTGGFVARRLGVQAASRKTVAILGASCFPRAVGRALVAAGREVVLVDQNPANCRVAQEEGLRVVCGNAHSERVRVQTGLDGAAAALGITVNGELNLLFLHNAAEDHKVADRYAVLETMETSGELAALQVAGGRALFGRGVDVERWDVLIRRDATAALTTVVEEKSELDPVQQWDMPEGLLPLVWVRGAKGEPVDAGTRLRSGDVVFWIYNRANEAEIMEWLRIGSWMTTAREWRLPPTPQSKAHPHPEPSIHGSAAPR